MKLEATNYEVIFGSNRILQCRGVCELVGKGINKQIIRFRDCEDGKILFECKVADPKARTVVKVANSIVQHVSKGYKADVSDKRIKITN
jgi:hypothetical protein